MSDSDELQYELHVLHATTGVDKVGEYPVGRWDNKEAGEQQGALPRAVNEGRRCRHT